MAVPIITPFPYLSPPGSFPPATIFCVMCTADFTPAVGADLGSYVIVPELPGSASNTPTQWVVTNLWWRCEVPSTSGPSQVIIERFIGGGIVGAGAFVVSNVINPVPAIIAQGAQVQSIQPPAFAQPFVNTGDVLRANYTAIGTNAANFTLILSLTVG